jgi:hypothetical protein
MLAEFTQLERDAMQLLGGLFTSIRYHIGWDRLRLGDMYAPEASGSDSDDDDNPGQAWAAPAPGNSPPPWE